MLKRNILLGSAFVMTLGTGVILAGTPFGGDDGGFIPPDAPKGPITKCEGNVGKGVGKLVGAIIKCHAGRVTGKYASDAAEDACEATALTKFNATKTVGCPPCITLAGIGATVEALVDSNNNKVYCSSPGSAFLGDDTGFIPADAPKGPISKCENTVGKGVGKLIAAIVKCHAGRATGKYPDDATEDGCEATALTKFGTTKTVGCDVCTSLASLGAFVEATADGANALVYCASPSGAFLDLP